MTAPLPHGYPDWGRYQASADKSLWSVANVTIGVSTNYGPFFVGDVDFVRLYFLASTNHFNVSVKFYADAALTQFLMSDAVSVRQDDTYRRSIPVTGAYVLVQVSPSAAGSIFDARLTTLRHPARGNDGSDRDGVLITDIDGSYAVGTTIVDATKVIPGPAVFYGHAKTASTFLDLQVVNYVGTVLGLVRIINSTGPVSHLVYLPPQHVRIRVTNNSAGAAFFDLSLMASIEVN